MAQRVGKYEVVRELAVGGMARVFLARVVGIAGFERHVVLKTLRATRGERDPAAAMFLDEARLLAMLHHHHIAQVYDVGVTPDGTYFMAMEYVHGETAASILARAEIERRTIPLELALGVISAAAAGLHHAHERRDRDGRPLGIVHRDVSPSNIVCGYDGSVKVIDFGIAKADVRSTVTQPGIIKGKLGYMAPEQVLGGHVDRRADVFGLGVVLYELTTGRRAFHGVSEHEAVKRLVRGDIAAPTQLVPGYPPDLEAIVLAALSIDPDDRPASAAELHGDLEALAARLGLALGPSAIARALGEQFGPRPEPWLPGAPLGAEPVAQAGSSDDGLVMQVIDTPSRRTVPVPRTRPYPTPSPMIIRFDESEPSRVLPLPAPEVTPTPRTRIRSQGTAPPDVEVLYEPPPFELPSRVEPALDLPEPVAISLAPRRRWLVPALLATAIVAIALALLSSTGALDHGRAPSAPDPRPPAPTVAPAPHPAPPPPRPANATATIALRVTTEPAGATVVLDGVRLGTAPYAAMLPAVPGRQAWLKVRLHGYIAVKQRVTLDHDITWSVQLVHTTQ